MQQQLTILLAALGASLVTADSCYHNGDAGRWIDSNSPAAVAAQLCNSGGGCYTATTQGRMCIQGDLSQCSALEEEAANDQSYHDDWFLWTVITCGDLSSTITT